MAYGNLCSWMLWNIVRKVSMKAVLIPLPWMTLLYLVTGSFRDMEKCTILICGITSLSIRRTCQQKILQEFINVLSMGKQFCRKTDHHPFLWCGFSISSVD